MAQRSQVSRYICCCLRVCSDGLVFVIVFWEEVKVEEGDEVGEAFMDLVGGSRGAMASKKIMEI